MITFQNRLQTVMQDGNLTVSDLARWFKRPHATVRQWSQGTIPGGAALDAAYLVGMLSKLEKLIKRKDGLPVPHMSMHERLDYMAQLRRKHLDGK